MPTDRPRGRIASAVLGVLLVLIGIPMLVCPGPGLASIAAGVGLLVYAFTGKRSEDRPEKG